MMPTTFALGSVFDDVLMLAACVRELTRQGSFTVWLDDEGMWHAMEASEVPSRRRGFAGTYGYLASLDDIAADLRHVMHTRAVRWMVTE
jgi:hypothetical protein